MAHFGMHQEGAHSRTTSAEEVPLPSHISKTVVKKLIETGNDLTNSQFAIADAQFSMTATQDISSEPEELLGIDSAGEPTGAQSRKRQNTIVHYQVRDLPLVRKGEFESKLLGSPNAGHTKKIMSAAMFGKQYLFLGSDNGLMAVDFSNNWEDLKPRSLMRGCGFRQLHVLNDHGVLIALTERKRKIRLYKLQSLLHLIKLGVFVDLSRKPPRWKEPLRCEQCGYLEGEEQEDKMDENSNIDGEAKVTKHQCKGNHKRAPSKGKLSAHQRKFSNLTSIIQNHISSTVEGTDLSSEEYFAAYSYARDYIKLEKNEEFTSFVVSETRNHIYLTCTMDKNRIVLFETAADNQSAEFELVKSFWVPETPRFVHVHTDAWTIQNIIICTSKNKLIVIDAHTSEVSEPAMVKQLIPRNEHHPEWLSFNSIPFNLNFLVADHALPPSPPMPMSPPMPISPPMPVSPTSPTSTSPPRSPNHKVHGTLSRSIYLSRRDGDTPDASSMSMRRQSKRRSWLYSGEVSVANESFTMSAAPYASNELSVSPSASYASNESFTVPTSDTSRTSNASSSSSVSSASSTKPFSNSQSLFITAPAPEQPLDISPAGDPVQEKSHGSHGSPPSIMRLTVREDTNPPADSQMRPYTHTLSSASIDNPRPQSFQLRPPPQLAPSSLQQPQPYQLFLCTVSTKSQVVNIRAEPFHSCPSIQWSKPPIKIHLLPTYDDVVVIAFQSHAVEIASMRTGRVMQQVTDGVPVRFLGESWSKTPLAVSRQGKSDYHRAYHQEFDGGVKRTIFWTCEMRDETYLYRGKIML